MKSFVALRKPVMNMQGPQGFRMKFHRVRFTSAAKVATVPLLILQFLGRTLTWFSNDDRIIEETRKETLSAVWKSSMCHLFLWFRSPSSQTVRERGRISNHEGCRTPQYCPRRIYPLVNWNAHLWRYWIPVWMTDYVAK